MDVLERLDIRGTLGRRGGWELLGGVGRPLPPATAEGEEAEDGDEDEQ